jgi:hypothetical protein
MARFSKVFQLITVVLLVAVVNVYVMAAPRVSNEPSKGDTAKTTTEATATTGTEAPKTPVAPVAVAADKLPLAPGSKINFNRLFSKTEISSRAATSHTFLNAKMAGRDVFKAPARTGKNVPQNDPNDNGGGGSKGTWIAVGIIAAVLTIAVIGLRNDRDN